MSVGKKTWACLWAGKMCMFGQVKWVCLWAGKMGMFVGR